MKKLYISLIVLAVCIVIGIISAVIYYSTAPTVLDKNGNPVSSVGAVLSIFLGSLIIGIIAAAVVFFMVEDCGTCNCIISQGDIDSAKESQANITKYSDVLSTLPSITIQTKCNAPPGVQCK